MNIYKLNISNMFFMSANETVHALFMALQEVGVRRPQHHLQPVLQTRVLNLYYRRYNKMLMTSPMLIVSMHLYIIQGVPWHFNSVLCLNCLLLCKKKNPLPYKYVSVLSSVQGRPEPPTDYVSPTTDNTTVVVSHHVNNMTQFLHVLLASLFFFFNAILSVLAHVWNKMYWSGFFNVTDDAACSAIGSLEQDHPDINLTEIRASGGNIPAIVVLQYYMTTRKWCR